METEHAIDALSALAHQTRLATFRLLVKAGNSGLPAGDVAETLKVRQNTLSTHLALLDRAGLIDSVREGRVIRYRANFHGMKALLTYLTEDCCQGDLHKTNYC